MIPSLTVPTIKPTTFATVQIPTATTTSGGTFLQKLSTFLDQAAPVVQKTQSIVSSLQTRVPGTNIPYNPQLAAQQAQQAQMQSGSMLKPVAIVGGVALLGFLIYKAVN